MENGSNTDHRGTALGVVSVAIGILTLGGSAFSAWTTYTANKRIQQEVEAAKQQLSGSTGWADTVAKLIETSPALLQNTSQLLLGVQELARYLNELGGLHAIINRDSPAAMQKRTIELERVYAEREEAAKLREERRRKQKIEEEQLRVKHQQELYEAKAKAADAQKQMYSAKRQAEKEANS